MFWQTHQPTHLLYFFLQFKKPHSLSGGYTSQLFARPLLYDLLLRQVPAEKIFMSKKVLKVVEEDDKVYIHCSDNSSYMGDILVGADGAYSAVRQNIYKDMSDQGLLPKADGEDLIVGYTCMVGVTNPLDPEKYPQLKDDHCHFESVIGGTSHSVKISPHLLVIALRLSILMTSRSFLFPLLFASGRQYARVTTRSVGDSVSSTNRQRRQKSRCL